MQILVNQHNDSPHRINVEAPKLQAFLQSELQALISQIAAAHGTNPKEMRGRRQDANICRARGEFAYRALTDFSVSLKSIGDYLCRACRESTCTSIAQHCKRTGDPVPRGLNADRYLRRATSRRRA